MCVHKVNRPLISGEWGRLHPFATSAIVTVAFTVAFVVPIGLDAFFFGSHRRPAINPASLGLFGLCLVVLFILQLRHLRRLVPRPFDDDGPKRTVIPNDPEATEPELVVARRYFADTRICDDYFGRDIAKIGDEVVLKFVHSRTGSSYGVRFPFPRFPVEGLAYSGTWMRNQRDWLLDLRVVLAEELQTLVIFEGHQVEHAGWTELTVAPERWPRGEGVILDWGDPDEAGGGSAVTEID